jgi:hypothetical protein
MGDRVPLQRLWEVGIVVLRVLVAEVLVVR